MVRANGGFDAVPAEPHEEEGDGNGDGVGDGVGDGANDDPLAELNALARGALDGDPDAVHGFLCAIAPTIRRTCRGVLGPDHADLEDTIQDSLVDVMRALPKYRFEGNPLHYVTKISIRRAIASRRRGASRIRQLRLLEAQQDPSAGGDSPGGELERSRVMRQLIRRLNPDQAETLLLRIVLGFSMEEIASITDAPLNTVKTRLRLGKNALRRFLDANTTAHPPAEPGIEGRKP